MYVVTLLFACYQLCFFSLSFALNLFCGFLFTSFYHVFFIYFVCYLFMSLTLNLLSHLHDNHVAIGVVLGGTIVYVKEGVFDLSKDPSSSRIYSYHTLQYNSNLPNHGETCHSIDINAQTSGHIHEPSQPPVDGNVDRPVSDGFSREHWLGFDIITPNHDNVPMVTGY